MNVDWNICIAIEASNSLGTRKCELNKLSASQRSFVCILFPALQFNSPFFIPLNPPQSSCASRKSDEWQTGREINPLAFLCVSPSNTRNFNRYHDAVIYVKTLHYLSTPPPPSPLCHVLSVITWRYVQNYPKNWSCIKVYQRFCSNSFWWRKSLDQ